MIWLLGVLAAAGGGYAVYRHNRKDDSASGWSVKVQNGYEAQWERCFARAGVLLAPLGLYKPRGSLTVKASPGDGQVGGHWGKLKPGGAITGAYTARSGSRQTVQLYTDPQGRETDGEMIHEAAHVLLNCDKRYRGSDQHSIMKKYGVPHA